MKAVVKREVEDLRGRRRDDVSAAQVVGVVGNVADGKVDHAAFRRKRAAAS